MGKITKRGIALLDGYKSDKGRGEIVQKLGNIEHRAERIISQTCEYACKYLQTADEDEIRTICEACPMSRLVELIL